MAATPASERHGAYAVPRRFGISAILALTTLYACVFAILKGYEALPVYYLFFGTLGVTTCLAQMYFGRVPRISSVVAGAILLPFWVFISAIYFEPPTRFVMFLSAYVVENVLSVTPFLIVGGAIIGYLAGAVMAGFFLLLDLAHASRKKATEEPEDKKDSAPPSSDNSETK